jgi:hypothetical protein
MAGDGTDAIDYSGSPEDITVSLSAMRTLIVLRYGTPTFFY